MRTLRAASSAFARYAKHCAAGGALLLALGAPAVATATAISNVRSDIDWGSFTLDLQGVTLRWDKQNSDTLASINLDGTSSSSSATTPSWNSPISSSENLAFAVATGNVNASAIRSTAYAEAFKPVVLYSDALGSGQRSGDFSITGNGSITLSVNYTLQLIQLSTSELCESAQALALADIILGNSTLGQLRNASDVISESVAGGASLPGYSKSGTLTVSQQFHDGDKGYMSFTSISHATARAPAPDTLALLALGMAAIGFSRRRQTQVAVARVR